MFSSPTAKLAESADRTRIGRGRLNAGEPQLAPVSDEDPRSVRQSNPDLPVWLAEIIERLHAKDPAKRFGSAREVADVLEQDLAAVQRGLPVAFKPRKPEAIAKRTGRKRALAIVLSISACALAVAAYERRTSTFGSPMTVFPSGFGTRHAGAVGGGQGDSHILINDSSRSDVIVGSGNPASKTWDVSGFGRMQIRSTFHARISKGKTFKVTTTADDNVLPFVRVEKAGDVLKLSLEKDRSFQMKKSPKAEIVLPALGGVDLSGASVGRLEGFDSEKDVEIRLSGASKLDGSLGAAKANLGVSGASTLTLTGRAQSAEVSADGASHLRLPEFVLEQCKVDLSGVTTTEISVRSTSPFSAEITGGSTLRGRVEAAALDMEVEKASRAILVGSAKRARIVASRASHLQLGAFESEAVDIKLSGASHAKVAVSGSLDYDVSSASHLSYKGNPSHVDGKRGSGSHVSHE